VECGTATLCKAYTGHGLADLAVAAIRQQKVSFPKAAGRDRLPGCHADAVF